MAEALFRAKTKDFSDNLSVSSCGLGAMTGDAASENSIIVMAERDVDISAHRSRQINQYIVDEADYIICLSENHYNYLTPFCKDKLLLLGDGISDPYGGDLTVYRECRNSIETAIDNLLASDVFFKIRTMTESDVETVTAIESDNFSDPWSADSFSSQIEKSYSFNPVAEYLGKVVGYVCCDNVVGEVYICTIAVDNAFRMRGIGKMLLSSVCEYCRDNSCDLLTLEVRVSNTPAISLYNSHGFENLGVRKNFYSKPTEDAYIMTKYFNGGK